MILEDGSFFAVLGLHLQDVSEWAISVIETETHPKTLLTDHVFLVGSRIYQAGW